MVVAMVVGWQLITFFLTRSRKLSLLGLLVMVEHDLLRRIEEIRGNQPKRNVR